MNAIPVTTMTVAVLALLFAGLSGRVVATRFSSQTSLGDGGQADIGSPLFCAVRGHGNFAEYVPLSLILLGLVEASGVSHGLVLGMAAALVVARVIHPIGIGMKAPNPFRAGGAILTLGVLIVGGVTLLVRAAIH